jgi:hypothetical protein
MWHLKWGHRSVLSPQHEIIPSCFFCLDFCNNFVANVHLKVHLFYLSFKNIFHPWHMAKYSFRSLNISSYVSNNISLMLAIYSKKDSLGFTCSRSCAHHSQDSILGLPRGQIKQSLNFSPPTSWGGKSRDHLILPLWLLQGENRATTWLCPFNFSKGEKEVAVHLCPFNFLKGGIGWLDFPSLSLWCKRFSMFRESRGHLIFCCFYELVFGNNFKQFFTILLLLFIPRCLYARKYWRLWEFLSWVNCSNSPKCDMWIHKDGDFTFEG